MAPAAKRTRTPSEIAPRRQNWKASVAAAERALAEDERLPLAWNYRGIALYNLGCAYALLGKNDAAIDALKGSLEAGFDMSDSLGSDSDLDGLRDDPRFKKLVERVGG